MIFDGSFVEKSGWLHGIDETAAIIEKEDGNIVETYPSFIRFVDKPETDQLKEFAKAAMQGLLSNQDLVERLEQNGELFYDLVCDSISLANIMIAELNKQK